MCCEVVRSEADATHTSFPPVVATVGNVVLKSTVKNERPTLAGIARPIRGFEHLMPGLSRLGHAVLIDQCVYEGNGVGNGGGQAECTLAIPNCKRRIQELVREEEFHCAAVVLGFGGQDFIQERSDIWFRLPTLGNCARSEGWVDKQGSSNLRIAIREFSLIEQ